MRRVMTAAVLMGLVSSPGCAADTATSGVPGTVTAIRYDALPDPVTRSFLRDHQDAAITSVGTSKSARDRVLYQIVFTQNGETNRAVYRPDGSLVTAGDR